MDAGCNSDDGLFAVDVLQIVATRHAHIVGFVYLAHKSVSCRTLHPNLGFHSSKAWTQKMNGSSPNYYLIQPQTQPRYRIMKNETKNETKEVLLKLFPRQEIIEHWYVLVPAFNTSTKDFYAAIENELKEREVPGLDITYVDFAEGGA